MKHALMYLLGLVRSFCLMIFELGVLALVAKVEGLETSLPVFCVIPLARNLKGVV